MRRRRSTPSSAPLLALISCLFVLSWVSSPGSSQLAAYSETRSFRDALEGRSMEEAISGPVDKDTSSYGDRTTSSAGNGESSSSATQKGSSNGNIGGMGDYGGPSQGPTGDSASSTAAGQMMITIPANGNLNPVTTQQRTMEPMDDQQQQKSSSNGGDGELEREAGPISPDFPIDTQQQLMEQQQQMLMMRAKMMGRSGRLTGSEAMPASMMLAMMRTMKEESMKKKNKMMMMKRMQASSPARSGRLQQEQQSEEPTAAPGAGSEKKSYDSDSMPGADGAQMTQPASTNGYGKKLGAQAGNGNGNGNGAYDNGSNKYNNAGSMQDPAGQQPVTMGPGASQEPKGYGGSQGGEQEEEEDMAGFARLQQMSKMADMKSMRAKYAKMMRANTNGAYKKQPTSNMAQSMIMSLANKAAYMANQKQQQQQQPQQPIMSSQRQMAPMMMPQNDGAYGSMAGSTMMNLPGYPQSSARSSYIMPTMSAYLGGAMPAASMQSGNTGNSYRPMGAAGAMRAMRRANQRKPEKKVSPAMMNAMLNKMLGGRQMQADDQSQQTAGNSYAFGRSSSEAPKSMQMAVAEMLMKRPAPARAEMLAQMMLMTNGGGSESPAMSYGGNNNNNNNKRELYKQMMMSAMQQQQQQMNEEPGSDIEQQQQQVGPMNGQANYGERASPAGRSSMVMMAGGANGYNNEAKSGYGGQGAATMSTTPSSYMGGAGTGRAAATMGPSTMSYGTAMGPQQSAMDGTTEGYAGSQEEIPATKGLEQQQEEQSAMPAYGAGMSSPKGGPMMAPKMSYGGSTASERPASNGKLMQQVMKMMRMKQQMSTMNGQQRKTPYGAGNGGEQQQMTTHGGDMEDGNKSPAMNGARQAYQAPASERLQQQQQQQEMQPDSKSYGGSSQGPQLGAYGTMSAAVPAKPNDEPTPAPDSGVKGAGAGGPGMGPMNKPAMSMGMSYNQDQQQQQQQGVGDADEQQQQQADDGQYGAAPMGQAEPFAFDYKVEDEATGNNQYRKEESDKNGVVRGSYGYMDSNSGVYRHVEYVADENGFRANIKSNEPGLSDKTTSQQQQPQQQQMELDRNGLGGSDSGPMAGTKSSSSPSSQGTDAAGPYPSQGQEPAAVPAIPAVGISPPPSSSSSLGGSAALQQEAQLPMIQQQRQMQSMPMGQKMPQDQQKQMSSYQQGQQQQQTSANGEK